MINRIKGNFTMIVNKIIDDGELSLAAKGLYSYLMSKPKDWKFSYRGITSQLKESENTIRRLVKELVEHQILLRKHIKNEKGQFIRWEWILHPTKEDLADFIDPTQKEKTAKSQSLANQSMEIQSMENDSLVSIYNINNTKESKMYKKTKNKERVLENSSKSEFSPPTLSEWKDYFLETVSKKIKSFNRDKANIEAELSYNFYDMRDWKVKSGNKLQKMKDWKRACLQWVLRSFDKLYEKRKNSKAFYDADYDADSWDREF